MWDMNRVFQNARPPWDCSVTDETPPTMIENPFSISKTMMAPMQGLYRLLPVNSCTYDRVRKNDRPIQFSIDGTTVRLGDMKWSLGAESEAVALFGLDIRNPTAPSFQHDEPGFLFDAAQGDHNVSLYYSRNKEILWFSAIEINKSMTFCDFDMGNQNL